MRSIPAALFLSLLISTCVFAADAAEGGKLNVPPKGFVALLNGTDLDGWWGLGTTHYNKYRNLSAEELEKFKAASRQSSVRR